MTRKIFLIFIASLASQAPASAAFRFGLGDSAAKRAAKVMEEAIPAFPVMVLPILPLQSVTTGQVIWPFGVQGGGHPNGHPGFDLFKEGKAMSMLTKKIRSIKKVFSDGIEVDSGAYDILSDAAKAIKGVPGLCLEIGTRRAGSAKIIINALLANGDLERSVVCVDPYGDIVHANEEGKYDRVDYTNGMRSDTQRNLHKYVHGKPVNLYLLILEDVEYFKRFSDGYPVYNKTKQLIDKYALVFFDGPHDIESVMREIEFFQSRTPQGGMWVFDDINKYPHDEAVEPKLFELGWKLAAKKSPKASYVKS